MAKSKKYSRKKSRSPKRKSIKSKSRVRTKSACNQLLKKKIRKNMDEYKSGRYKSRQQALAVSYSQTKKLSPYCSRYFKRK
jgi:hypothetical protein